jgi:excisionase family DNA binding protein
VVTPPTGRRARHDGAGDASRAAGATGALFTVADAAAYLSVTERFIRRLIHERRIPVIRLGRHVRLAEADLEAFVAAGRQPALAPAAGDWARR